MNILMVNLPFLGHTNPTLSLAKQKGIPAVRQFLQPAWNEDTWNCI